MFKKTSWLLILVLAFGMFAVGCSNNSDGGGDDATADATKLDQIIEKGVLVLGCDDEFPPMGFRDSDGKVVGFDIDLGEAVAAELGVELEVKPIDWKTKEMELKNGSIDVIWNGYTMTAARDEQVEFTKPYLNNEQVIVVGADSDIKSKADLAGLVMGCQAESAAESAIKGDEEFMNSLQELRLYDTYQGALLDLNVADRIAAVAVDRVLIEYAMKQEPGKYRILDEALAKEYYGIGCPYGEVELREAIDNALDKLQEDGTIDKICDTWFNENIVIRDVEKMTQDELKALEA